jgi:hypothetical protein
MIEEGQASTDLKRRLLALVPAELHPHLGQALNWQAWAEEEEDQSVPAVQHAAQLVAILRLVACESYRYR